MDDGEQAGHGRGLEEASTVDDELVSEGVVHVTGKHIDEGKTGVLADRQDYLGVPERPHRGGGDEDGVRGGNLGDYW